MLCDENISEELRRLAYMQLYEIHLDEQDLEDFRREMAAGTKKNASRASSMNGNL